MKNFPRHNPPCRSPRHKNICACKNLVVVYRHFMQTWSNEYTYYTCSKTWTQQILFQKLTDRQREEKRRAVVSLTALVVWWDWSFSFQNESSETKFHLKKDTRIHVLQLLLWLIVYLFEDFLLLQKNVRYAEANAKTNTHTAKQ